jgi:hypothetical protein
VEHIGYCHVPALGFVLISTLGLLVESQIKIKLDFFIIAELSQSSLPKPHPALSMCEFVSA